MRPSITSLGLIMSVQIKNLHITLPNCVLLELFVDRNGFAPCSTAIVQVLYGYLQLG